MLNGKGRAAALKGEDYLRLSNAHPPSTLQPKPYTLKNTLEHFGVHKPSVMIASSGREDLRGLYKGLYKDNGKLKLLFRI